MPEQTIPEILPIYLIPVDALVESPWNPMQDSAKSFENLMENIKQNGFSEPLLVVPLHTPWLNEGSPFGTFRIVSGHDRAKAAKAVGLTEVPCCVAENIDERMQKLLTVRMNAIRKKMNPQKFFALYQEVVAASTSEEAAKNQMMFTDPGMLDALIAEARKSLPKELRKEFDEKKDKIVSAADLTSVISELVSRCGTQLDHGFAIFQFGGQESIYVALDKELHAKLLTMTERSVTENKHITEILKQELGIA